MSMAGRRVWIHGVRFASRDRNKQRRIFAYTAVVTCALQALLSPSCAFLVLFPLLHFSMAKDKSEKKEKKEKKTKEVTETVQESIERNEDVEMGDAELVKVHSSLLLWSCPFKSGS